MKRIYFLLLILLSVVSATDRKHRYYLTEHDFFTSHPVPGSEVIGKPHILAEYDENNLLITKIEKNFKGEILKVERFTYTDSTTTLREKKVYDGKDRLIKMTVFGPEEKSHQFIKYAFGIDTVTAWGDRFTCTTFREDGQPTVHEFFDVDGSNYGDIGFFYDSLGIMISQVWIGMPSKRIIRRYDYIPIIGTNVTRIMEYDSNSVFVSELKLDEEGKEEVFSFTSPNNSEYVNHTRISYIIEDNLEEGHIDWIKEFETTGKNDTQRFNFPQELLFAGEYEHIPTCILQDEAIYRIVFNGKSAKGFKAIEKEVNTITYDITPPEITLTVDSLIRRPEITFETNEPLQSATLQWSPVIALQDSIHTVVVQFSEEDLDYSGRGKFILTNQPKLIDDSDYDVSITGIDRAGNIAVSPTIRDIHYDITPPVISILSPVENVFYSEILVEYSTDGTLKEGKLIVEPIGENRDADSLHVFFLYDSLLEKGEHIIKLNQMIPLIDSCAYQIILVGVDHTGNSSDTVFLAPVYYDVSPPVLTIIDPYDGEAINESIVSYILSEPLLSGEFRWEQVDGAPDTLSPHIVPLTNDELKKGEKINIMLTNQPILKDGSVYIVIFEGEDRAGLEGEPGIILNVRYDSTPPVFSDVFPLSGEVVNHSEISYTLSEDLQKGTVTWTRIGGNQDFNSPHIINLVGRELSSGIHESNTLYNIPFLQNGTIYTIEYNGIDPAGNEASPIIIEDVAFDNVSPIIAFLDPTPIAILNHTRFGIIVNERLKSAFITVDGITGNSEPATHQIVDIPEPYLNPGIYREVVFPISQFLNSNTTYYLSLSGTDFAGNSSIESHKTIVYDITPPDLIINYPSSGMALSQFRIAYKILEELRDGKFILTQTGGVIDPYSPRIIILTGDELKTAQDSLKIPDNQMELQSGSIYRIICEITDLAGNISQSEPVYDFLFETDKPEISILNPVENQVVLNTVISYSLTEDIETGTAIWTREAGILDQNSPHFIELTENERTAGNHLDMVLSNQPELNVGTVYSLSITGVDPAGNESEPVIVHGINMARSIEGNWSFKGTYMNLVWTFQGDEGTNGIRGKATQKIIVGSKVYSQESGKYALDYSVKPWVMEWKLESGKKKISLFEFTDRNHLKAITGDSKPQNWSDGDVLIYEFQPE